MYQSGRAGDKAKKRKSPAKNGRVGITVDKCLNAILEQQFNLWAKPFCCNIQLRSTLFGC